ncbi:hypothetical protein J4G07_09545 [Candidatus Poribacteria bacterium]|nr:hypothetical protein [Candidatus Poribacteria bacterium]
MSHTKDRIHFRYQIIGKIGMLLLIGVLSAGCAVPPQPSVDVYMEPIVGRFNAQINPETGAATVEKKGIAVTIKPFDEVELFALIEDPRVNPYLLVGKNGAVEPIYTVFDITVHNRENRRVLVDDTAILIDGNGGQYANLSNDYFDALYDNVNLSQRNSWEAGYPYMPTAYGYYPYYGHYQSYIDAEALELGRIVIEDHIFEGAKLFSGAKRSGFLIFDRLESAATDIRIVVPQVRIVHPNGKEDKLEFKIDFRQVLP